MTTSSGQHGFAVRLRWKAFEGAMNADILIDFMKRLIKDAKAGEPGGKDRKGCKKVFLILDNLRVHHSKPVKARAGGEQGTHRGVLPAQL